MKRIISIFLLSAMLLTMAVSCAENKDTPNETDAEGTKAEEIGTETLRSQTKDSLPDDLNYDGQSFRILVRDDDQFEIEFNVEEDNGDVVESAIYKRNLDVSERLNISYEPFVRGESGDYINEIGRIRTDITSNDDAYDAISGYSIHIVTLLTEGLFVDLNELEYLDFSQPWWPESVKNEMTIAGKLFFITGDICYTALSKAECFYFNKKLAEDNHLDNLYDVVNRGDWTFDYYLSLHPNLYNDLNGNGKQDDDDYYCTAMTAYNNVDSLWGAFHMNITNFDENGYPFLDFNNEKSVNIINMAHKILYETDGVHVPRNSLEDMATVFNMFKADRAIFIMWEFTASNNLRDMESDYGIIPYPKYNESQDSYGTYVQDGHSLVCVPTSNRDLSFTSACIEALAAESYRYVTPAYFQTALQDKYSRDEESIQMLQLVKDSIKYNFGYVYCLEAMQTIRTLMNKGSTGDTNFASYYDKNQKSWNRKLTKMIEKFDENVG